MFSKELEEVIEAALADGALTDKERAVLHKRAQAEGVDPDELDIVIDGRLAKMKKQEDWLRPAPPKEATNQKYGNVLKCPSCGAQVVGGSAVCPECGYAFSNVSANRSAEKLQEQLDDFNRRQEERVTSSIGGWLTAAMGTDKSKHKMDLISNFTVPNTRTDLLEFLTMVQPRANSTGPRNGLNMSREEDLSYAYWLLYTNCINKARISFLNDRDFAPYFSWYEKELQKTKGFIGWWKCNPKTRLVLMIILGYIAFFTFLGIMIGSE